MNKFGPLLLTALGALFLTGCGSVAKPKAIDPATGRIKTSSIYGESKPNVLKNEKIEIARYKDFILVLADEFIVTQTVNLKFFKEVLSKEQLEEKLIKENRADGISDVSGLIAWKRAAENYKPFLVLKPEIRREDNKAFFKFKVYAADTASVVFESELPIDYMWKGIGDDVLFYPLYNSFIDWLKAQN